MSRPRPEIGGVLSPRRHAPVDSGATMVAIATVLAAMLLYALVWWVLGTIDDGDVVAAATVRDAAIVRSGAPAGVSPWRA